MASLEKIMTALGNAKSAYEAETDPEKKADLFAKGKRLSEMASNFKEEERPSKLDFLNKALIETVGGAIDWVNPRPDITGSATVGMKSLMEKGGAPVADVPPETIGEHMASGAGFAAGALLPSIGVAKGVATAGGAVGAVADDVARSLMTKGGVAADLFAGAAGEGTVAKAKEEGASPLTQELLRVAVPMAGLAAAPTIAKTAASAATGIPFIGTAAKTAASISRGAFNALTAQTEASSRRMAAGHVQRLAGGKVRASELSTKLTKDNPLGKTPAARTDDPVLRGLEEALKRENPLVRVELENRVSETRKLAGLGLEAVGGDVKTAQNLLKRQVKKFSNLIDRRVDDAINLADDSITLAGANITEGQASMNVVSRLKAALANEKTRERELWAKIPQGQVVSTQVSKEVAKSMDDDTARALRKWLPSDDLNLLLKKPTHDGKGGLGNETEVKELLGVYSSLRQIAAEAGAGVTPRPREKAMANQLADAILMDLEGVKGAVQARAFTRALNKKFGDPAVQKILEVNRQGLHKTATPVALDKTLKPGTAGGAADDAIRTAAPDTKGDIGEFLRGRYLDEVYDVDGVFTPKKAKQWVKKNRAILKQHPELRDEIMRATSNRKNADLFSIKSTARKSLIENESITARFSLSHEDKAVLEIIGSDDPVKAAKALMASASKDETAFITDGIKNSFEKYIINGGTEVGILNGQKLKTFMDNKPLRSAMREVFTKDELGNIDTIVNSLAKVDSKNIQHVKAVFDSPASAILRYVSEYAGLNVGASVGKGGAALKAAATGSRIGRNLFNRFTSKGARDVMTAAIRDEAGDGSIMKALLLTPAEFSADAVAQRSLAPFMIGLATAPISKKITITPGNYIPETPEETDRVNRLSDELSRQP